MGTAGTGVTTAPGGQINTIGGDYGQEIGTSTTIDGALTADVVNNSGSMNGSGLISGDFNDLGTIAPGDDGIGSLSIAGDYTQTGIMDIDMTGPDSSSTLNVTGDAVLGGTMVASLLNGFVPVPGDSFLVMTYESESGSFDNIEGPGLSADEYWSMTYGSNGMYMTLDTQSSATPEPGTMFLLACGLGALLWARRSAAIQDLSRRDPA
jgi:hypothetical protein